MFCLLDGLYWHQYVHKVVLIVERYWIDRKGKKRERGKKMTKWNKVQPETIANKESN
jgi:hypothetical protein